MNVAAFGQWRFAWAATTLCVLAGTLLTATAGAQTQVSPYQAPPYANNTNVPRAATGYRAAAVPPTQANAAVQGYPARGNYAQAAAPAGQLPQNSNPNYGAAQRDRVNVAESRRAPAGQPLTNNAAQQAKIDPRHPLAPVVGDLAQADQVLSTIKNYECIFSKSEVVNGELNPTETMYFKVRHDPFSVYLYCFGPGKPKGQEAIYVAGRNDGQVIAHSTGIRAIAGTVHLDPLSARMMEGNRHPITKVGIKNLTDKLLDRYVRESQFGGSVVKEYQDVQVAGRTCKCLEVVHPQPYKPFDFHVMRIYLDKEWKIPICMQGYGWPTEPGAAPPLIEEYTYSRLKFNLPLTDADFDPNNPNYGY